MHFGGGQMAILAALKKYDIGWSFWGFVLAAVFGTFALYQEFWKTTSPLLRFELLSNTPVLDVREKLTELEVLYQKQDIAKSGQTLSVLLIRVLNHGTANLLSTHYDSKAPIGVVITGGKLLRAEISSTSNDYLSKAAAVKATDASATFDPVILEPTEWFVVKLLVLHNAGTPPSLTGSGKIAGMHSIPITQLPAGDQEDFWSHAFSGGVWTQLARLGGYFLALPILFAALLIPPITVFVAISMWRRKRLVSRFRQNAKVHLDPADEFIFEGFVNMGAQYVQRLTNLVADPDRLQERVADYLAGRDSKHPERQIHPAVVWPAMINDMIEHAFIKQVDGRWVPSPDRLKVATSFIDYLELVGASSV